MGGEEKRHQMMQNLFGDQSEEEEELDSEHESNPQLNYPSDEGEGGGGAEQEGEGEVEGQGEVEIESDGDGEPDPGESEGEREQSSQEVEAGEREESEGRDSDSDVKDDGDGYSQRGVTSKRRDDVVETGSERSEENHYAPHDDEEEEVDEARSPSGSPRDEKDETRDQHSAPEIRDVFGDFDDDEEEEMGFAVQQDMEQDSNRYPVEEEGSYGKNLRPEDILADEDHQYESEEENIEIKTKEKPLGPPLELEVPLRPPPALPEKMNMIKVSNIMGVDPKPFDPKTYVEEDTFVTDESGARKRIRLENNIVRWRTTRNPDGTTSCESNARFVRWSDGSLQLLIGNEVLDISVQDAQHDQAHLFLRHGKGILQSQGRLLRKMRFMPSSLSSNSHRLLTALVDSRHKKVYKVKNCITDIDPEREKEEKEKAESQTIRANVLLNRKREKVSRKYTPAVDRRRQLSPGFLEDALDEEDETDYYDSRRSQRRFEDDLEAEARAEKRIMNVKKSQGPKDIPRKSSFPPAKSSRNPMGYQDDEREESEYETDDEEDERPPSRKRDEDTEPEYEDEEEEEEHYEEAEQVNDASDEEEEEVLLILLKNIVGSNFACWFIFVLLLTSAFLLCNKIFCMWLVHAEPKQKSKEFRSSTKRKGFESDEDSPPRKTTTHRRMAVVYDSDEE
uniref:RNA polymerase-associated protein LEO1 n=1 Tax=Cajanus cajan TaxID=3821 RepID=A0A151SLW2_CAJCA|nr:LOW QUALITY PROTEIN: RNA polymerase-associated protein LEO1 [Cajanus cajan]